MKKTLRITALDNGDLSISAMPSKPQTFGWGSSDLQCPLLKSKGWSIDTRSLSTIETP